MMPTKMYQPLPKQEAFHRSKAPERLAIGSNRGAKTTCCAMEVAWAVTGTHPYLYYPKENGRCFCVAKNIEKIGEVLAYKLLKRGGAMKMARDPETGIYRRWIPEIDGYDQSKLIGSFPLLDSRTIKNIRWEKRGIPKKIEMNNGWEIMFFSADGKTPDGVDVDLVWFDEEIEAQAWYEEMSARLLDRSGKFIWSATPQSATDVLRTLHEEAQRQVGVPNPRIEEFHFMLDDNPFISDEDKRIFKEKAASDPDNYKVRVLGEFLVYSQMVYPEFKRTVHCIQPFDLPEKWCRYMVLDPGFANTCALFFAVPNPDDEDHAGRVYLYDEMYANQCSAKEFVARLFHKVKHQSFQEFLIDAHGSRRTEINAKTIKEQYEEQLEANGIYSIGGGSTFTPINAVEGQFGDSMIEGQVSQVRSWLWSNEKLGGDPVLRVFDGNCGTFVQEMMHYKNRIVNGKPTNKPDSRRYSHGPDCLRYAVMHGLPWLPPRKTKGRLTGWMRRFAAKKERKRAEQGNFVVLGQN